MSAYYRAKAKNQAAAAALPPKAPDYSYLRMTREETAEDSGDPRRRSGLN